MGVTLIGLLAGLVIIAVAVIAGSKEIEKEDPVLKDLEDEDYDYLEEYWSKGNRV